ncbi:DNA polymerase epsilon subunit 2-like [Vanessa atalanta]|uniref:DNA polymerase epsilon subunit 2-like n=1 Tax=Vanessa atalanta TaxID=42275 RepID=UPI001FCD3B4D|nr:DNA polymerase epsilon subunit 2-like [Vanessa atalanta]XP_047539511.1 DNA polymerase epsilon subunit 2-like [Vanessa atalanta]
MGELQQIRLEINNAFKLSGFTIRREASTFLAEQLSTSSQQERKKLIDKLLAHILHQCLSHPVLEKHHLEVAFRECSLSGLEETETILNVIDAFSVPKLNYDNDRKKFVKDVNASNNLYPEPKWKAQYLNDRYTMIWQRTIRNKLFAKETLPSMESENRFQLRKIEVLQSSSSRVDNVIVLGLLTQLTEGKYYLEDPTGSVLLDMTQTRYHSGLFTESSFVLAEGYYDDKVLNVMGLVLPPSESRAISLPFFGSLNTFGGKSKSLLKNSQNLLKIEQDNDDGMIVFISDVWFDNLKVISKLKALFSGYNDFPPIAIVFMGEFLSCPYGYEHSTQLKAALINLCDIVIPFTKLRQSCKFIFVPGRGDPIAPNILPRPAIPNSVTKEIRDKLGESVIFTTNPCRIQYCTQELVIIRQDLVTKMCRNSIHFPDTGDIPDHLTKTLLSQCTLSPLSLGVQPVFWKHADALSLYPMPDLVVVADHFQPYTRTYQNCQVINPGSFPRTEFSFKVYVPASRTVEDSQIPNDDT